MGRKRIWRWTLAGLALVIVIAVAGGYFYLQSSGFREFALRKIVDQVDQSTGGKTHIEALDFKLSTLTAHLYGIVLRGEGPVDAPPLLQVDKLTVGLKIKSVFRREINLSELLFEH